MHSCKCSQSHTHTHTIIVTKSRSTKWNSHKNDRLLVKWGLFSSWTQKNTRTERQSLSLGFRMLKIDEERESLGDTRLWQRLFQFQISFPKVEQEGQPEWRGSSSIAELLYWSNYEDQQDFDQTERIIVFLDSGQNHWLWKFHNKESRTWNTKNYKEKHHKMSE